MYEDSKKPIDETVEGIVTDDKVEPIFMTNIELPIIVNPLTNTIWLSEEPYANIEKPNWYISVEVSTAFKE